MLTDEEFAAAFDRGRRGMLAWIEENIPPLEFPDPDEIEIPNTRISF